MNDTIKERLEYLKTELRAERISYGELAELQTLVDYIDPSDVELLEAAGVPENQPIKEMYELKDKKFIYRGDTLILAFSSNVTVDEVTIILNSLNNL